MLEANAEFAYNKILSAKIIKVVLNIIISLKCLSLSLMLLTQVKCERRVIAVVNLEHPICMMDLLTKSHFNEKMKSYHSLTCLLSRADLVCKSADGSSDDFHLTQLKC